MKLEYYPETDTLYIDLLEKSSASSLEISEEVVLDYDESRRLVGIDIGNASKKVSFEIIEKIARFFILAVLNNRLWKLNGNFPQPNGFRRPKLCATISRCWKRAFFSCLVP